MDISYEWESSLLPVIFNCTKDEFYGKVNSAKRTVNTLFSIVFFKDRVEVWGFL